MKRLVLITFSLLLLACSSKIKKEPVAEKPFVSKFPNYTITDYQNGKALYTNHCGSCHGLKPLNVLDENGWRGIVPDMVQKANSKSQFYKLTAKDEDLILKYVLNSI